MRYDIDKTWFSDLLGELLEKKFSFDTDFTKQNYLLVRSKVYVEMRKAVARHYGYYGDELKELQNATEKMLVFA